MSTPTGANIKKSDFDIFGLVRNILNYDCNTEKASPPGNQHFALLVKKSTNSDVCH